MKYFFALSAKPQKSCNDGKFWPLVFLTQINQGSNQSARMKILGFLFKISCFVRVNC